MDFNLIQTFIVAAEYQSYTKTAEQLGLTQPAVSAAIKRLEGVIGKPLFVKKGRGVTLTSTAHQLLPQFKQAVDIIGHALTEKKHFDVYCSEILLHIMPSIENTVIYETSPDKCFLFELLRQQKVDLVIDTIITKDAAFVIEDVYEEEAVIICREQHPRIQGKLNKEQFYNETHCLFSGKWNNMSGFEQLARENIQERKVERITSSLAGMALYITHRDCLGIVPKSFATRWSHVLQLQMLPCPISLQAIPYHFAYHKRDINNPAHIELRKKIKAQLSAKTLTTM
ncbi:MAG: LysR family transcriptional regulator [Vibrio fluvialis]